MNELSTKPAAPTAVDAARLAGMEWRLIGPHRGGRVVAVAGDPSDPLVFYFGSTGGGVWKTADGGVTWRNISDGFFRTASVGALTVAPSDPNVLYAGMGEATIRGNVSYGDGVYKSTDAGRTWQHLGLAETRHIAKIRVHPRDPDLVYVAAFGHAFGPNAERGVYRSRDGGGTWEKVLFRSERAGAIDLALDPTNPRFLYAAIWDAHRTPHSLVSGGPDSGLFRSRDGGDTWEEITNRPGLPDGIKGKIGVVPSPAQPGRVWAIVEAAEGGLFRSDDYGDTWECVSQFRELIQRPWYYMHVFADPQDPETVWVLNLRCWKSTDGGRTFTGVDVPHVDNHDLWIDPRNPQRMINGNDGGACVTYNGGKIWSSIYNQPTAEFYHVTTDTQVPYRVYGSQQDNTAISLPSLSSEGAITTADWYEPGGGESGYIAVHPNDPNIVYGGSYSGTITRYDRRTGQSRDITVWPVNFAGWGAKDMKYRFNWTFPLTLSPHDPGVLYACGNHVFRSTDEGASWEAISPDLTRNDPATLEPSGGPITKDNISTENYATIFAFAESPQQPGVFWAGSDDGLIHVSRDGGQTWVNVTPPDLPEWALISIIEPSPHDAATAYVAATRYKLDDTTPYLYKTSDYGQTWTRIVDGIRPGDFTRVIREDPNRRGLLYAGTETGLYISFDDGARWQPFQLNLPVCPIHDLVVKDTDLVVATHGRSFWILDDITPLHQLTDEALAAPAALFAPRPTYRFKVYWGPSAIPQGTYRRSGTLIVTYDEEERPTGELGLRLVDAGQNPPTGVIVNYLLRERPEGPVTLTFLDADGEVINSFRSRTSRDTEGDDPTGPPWVPIEPGLNRFVWDMRYRRAPEVPGAAFWAGGTQGPVVPPGRYQVRLSIGNEHWTESFEIRKDPRVAASDDDLRAQFALQMQIHEKLTAVHTGVNQIRDARRQIEELERRIQGIESAQGLTETTNAVKAELRSIEAELIQVEAEVTYDTLKHPVKLNNQLATLSAVLGAADAPPTRQAYEAFDALATQADEHLGRLRALLAGEVADLNAQARELAVPAVAVPGESPGTDA